MENKANCCQFFFLKILRVFGLSTLSSFTVIFGVISCLVSVPRCTSAGLTAHFVDLQLAVETG